MESIDNLELKRFCKQDTVCMKPSRAIMNPFFTPTYVKFPKTVDTACYIDTVKKPINNSNTLFSLSRINKLKKQAGNCNG